MRLFRVIIPLVAAVIFSYGPLVSDNIYSLSFKNKLTILGDLSTFESSCSESNCIKKYLVDLHDISISSYNAIGIGIINGESNWYCTLPENKLLKLYETSGHKDSLGSIRQQYHFFTIPNICNPVIVGIIPSQKHTAIARIGWRAGSLVVSSNKVLAGYKNLTDFFNVYSRILSGLLCILFLFFLSTSINYQIPGSLFYRYGILSLSIHFILSSSILSTSFPFFSYIEHPLLKSFGSIAIACIALSLRSAKNLDPFKITKSREINTLNYLILLCSFCFVYLLFPGTLYLTVQSALCFILFSYAARSKSTSVALISLCFSSDLVSAWGILPALPTNLTSHYTLFLFIFDSFSIVNSLNRVGSTKESTSVEENTKLLLAIVKRFNIKRVSYSIFDTSHNVVSTFIKPKQPSVTAPTVPQIMARVLTTGRAILRMNVNDPSHRLLKSIRKNIKYSGNEYSVFPLKYYGKTLGTLNITNYPVSTFTDPMECQHFLLSLRTHIPKLSHSIHLDSLTKNTTESLYILEAENSFENDISFQNLNLILDRLCSKLDLRIIVSKANHKNSHFETFGSYNYNSDDANILQSHTPRISKDLLTSPANLALLGNETVFIDDITRLFPVYSEYVKKLFSNNNTKTLFVNSLAIDDTQSWGVCWIESENKLVKPVADIKSISALAASAIERMLNKTYKRIREDRLLGKLKDVVPTHVIEKLSRGIDPIEIDEGFILNIDLSGSTPLSKSIGTEKFSEIINNINSRLIDDLSETGFVARMVIWDAFIFTISANNISAKLIDDLPSRIKSVVSTATKGKLGFRGVLHYGDITRNISTGTPKSWAVVGSALAESCKIEGSFKSVKNQIILSNVAIKRLKPPFTSNPDILAQQELEDKEVA